MWQGRNDGDSPLVLRVFQKVKLENDFRNIKNKDFVLQGFAVDEGVKRNMGRVGAAEAPNIIRKNMSNFPITSPYFNLLDFGDVICEDGNLENAQEKLSNSVSNIISKNGKSIVLGGGHEVMFAHYSGLKKALPNKKIGIINIDAHFDNRMKSVEIGATSGTGFSQIAESGDLHSLHIGIQKNSNTLQLFDYAHQNKMKYLIADELYYENLHHIYETIDAFTKEIDVLYLTICMDVFNASIAPGVSAAAYNGIFADVTFMNFFRHILGNEKMIAMDIAEVNPIYDIQERTARLAASLVNEWLTI
ncbi:formimidoylglutamase [Frigoriflavimonas asaccharolytica]|uniref:Formimidoylglutamase n=1 Tax=Frigoriflavimonas asaccharolytica TaxID=2735899 RepID=A0A8J8KCN9_9FLAO|nr:formimidoylglutamase [Frigoriflavimonas asaccharolytica]NRS93859.1 formiminoglutamase [Frigoriflavimonas asaccharolytica]